MAMTFGPPPDSHVSPAQLADRLTHYVSKADLDQRLTVVERHIRAIEHRITVIGAQQMSDQDTLNAVGTALATLTATVASDDAGLTADVAALQAEIAALQAAAGAGTPLDFTAVNDAVTALQGSVASNTAGIASVAALVPAPPAPPAGG